MSNLSGSGLDLSKLTTWTFIPPHGVRFQNDVGSGVTVIFERGREEEVAQSLQQQISQSLMYSKGLVPEGIPVEERTVSETPSPDVLKGLEALGWIVDERGKLVQKGRP